MLVPVIAIVLGPRRGGIFLAAALVPIVAWSLNAHAPVSTGGGASLFVGTYLPGGGTLPGTKRDLKAETLRFAPQLRNPRRSRALPGDKVMDTVAARRPQLARDAALRAAGLHNLSTYPREDPAGFAAMILKKLPRLWLKPSPRGAGLRGTPLRLWHLAIVLIAIIGLVRKPDRLILAALLAFTAFHLLVPAMPRYALPLLPALIAAGCAGWRSPRTRPALPDWPASLARRLSRRASPSRSA